MVPLLVLLLLMMIIRLMTMPIIVIMSVVITPIAMISTNGAIRIVPIKLSEQ